MVCRTSSMLCESDIGPTKTQKQQSLFGLAGLESPSAGRLAEPCAEKFMHDHAWTGLLDFWLLPFRVSFSEKGCEGIPSAKTPLLVVEDCSGGGRYVFK